MLNGFQPFASFFYNTEGLPYFSVGMGNFGTQIAKSSGWLGGAAPAAAAAVPKGIGGLVRLKVYVKPDGSVRDTEVLGGNPILAESAQRSVIQWKFSPAGSERRPRWLC